MSVEVEVVLDRKFAIGESLLWVPEEARIYFVDIKAPALYSLRLADGELRCWQLDSDVGGFALDGHGRAIVGLRTGLYWLSLEDGSTKNIVSAPFDTNLIRFNESACDSRGRFWIGSMTDPLNDMQTQQMGALYSYTILEGLRAYPDLSYITNGMAWNEDESTFFIAHSTARIIYAYAYDNEAGALSRGSQFAAIDHPHGIPDGAAVDSEGGYWCALHGAGRVHRYDRTGALTEIVTLPVSQPTMCCFAGDDLRDLYISSARAGLDAEALEHEPLAGAIFRIRSKYQGLIRNWRVA